MRDLIKKILKEIIFTDPDMEKFKWRFVQKVKHPDKTTLIHTFVTPKYKYLVHSEQYENHFYLISFFPKLNKDFYVKNYIKKVKGDPHYDEYTYQTKENMMIKILSLMAKHMDDIFKNDPDASFGWYGAADVKTKDPDQDMIKTRRYDIYNKLFSDHFKNTHVLKAISEFSGALLLNKEVLKDYPEIEMYGADILKSHL